MFGVNKERLVKNLCRLSCQACDYIDKFCDCKYMKDPPESYNGEAKGCPELMMAALLIGAMTGEEFYTLAARAGITVDEQVERYIDVNKLLLEMKKECRDNLLGKENE